MTSTQIGIAVGATLAIVWAVVGFWAFLFVAVAMAVGAFIGRVADGKTDMGAVVNAFRGKRSSS